MYFLSCCCPQHLLHKNYDTTAVDLVSGSWKTRMESILKSRITYRYLIMLSSPCHRIYDKLRGNCLETRQLEMRHMYCVEKQRDKTKESLPKDKSSSRTQKDKTLYTKSIAAKNKYQAAESTRQYYCWDDVHS